MIPRLRFLKIHIVQPDLNFLKIKYCFSLMIFALMIFASLESFQARAFIFSVVVRKQLTKVGYLGPNRSLKSLKVFPNQTFK